jgi:hypothetical protein
VTIFIGLTQFGCQSLPMIFNKILGTDSITSANLADWNKAVAGVDPVLLEKIGSLNMLNAITPEAFQLIKAEALNAIEINDLKQLSLDQLAEIIYSKSFDSLNANTKSAIVSLSNNEDIVSSGHRLNGQMMFCLVLSFILAFIN